MKTYITEGYPPVEIIPILFELSGAVCGIVWIALGLCIILTFKRHALAITTWSFIATILTITAPSVEWSRIMIRWLDGTRPPSDIAVSWLTVIAEVILLSVALFVVVIAEARRHPSARPYVSAIVMLLSTELVSILQYYTQYGWSGWYYWNNGVPALLALGWILLTVALLARRGNGEGAVVHSPRRVIARYTEH